MIAIQRHGWTGTLGTSSPEFPGMDWEEAKALVVERCRCSRRTGYNPALVALAWEFVIEKFGCDAELENFPIRDVVEFFLDSL